MVEDMMAAAKVAEVVEQVMGGAGATGRTEGLVVAVAAARVTANTETHHHSSGT